MLAGDVSVHLFEWRWVDIAAECETVLGPAGVKAVQISPPEEHSIVPSHDWSERYQPVSYSIAHSRSGTGVEFTDMVNRCNAVGVGIIADAVINHMTNFPSPGVGSNGTSYSKYEYPGLYTAVDFHTPCAVTDYQSAANVQDCELFSLPDLRTELVSVRQKIAAYLIMLARKRFSFFAVYAKTIRQLALPIATIAMILAIAQLMNYSGMTASLALAFAKTGFVFPFVAARRSRRRITTARATARVAPPTSPSSRSSASATNSAASMASTSHS